MIQQFRKEFDDNLKPLVPQPVNMTCEAKTDIELRKECSFSGFEDVEDQFNCLERFGAQESIKRCTEGHATMSGSYLYNHKNEFYCLASKYPDVKLNDQVHQCLNLFYDYPVDNCLKAFELSIGGHELLDFVYDQN